MKLSYFLSKRIRSYPNTFSSIVHKIAIISIGMGLIVSILAFSVLHGFQKNVKDIIYSFSSHLIISHYANENTIQEKPMIKPPLFEAGEPFPFIQSVDPYCHKAGLIKTQNEVIGMLFKGIEKPKSKRNAGLRIIEGRFISFSDSTYVHEIIISLLMAKKIKASVGDEIIAHFFDDPPRSRKLKIVGFYETHMSEYFDDKVIIGDLGLVQRLNGWSHEEVGGLEIMLRPDWFTFSFLWKNRIDYEGSLTEPGWIRRALSILGVTLDCLTNRDRVMQNVARQIINEQTDYDLYVESAHQKYSIIFDWLDLLNRQVYILLFIILTVVSVNMISVTLILVIDRTPMVGILKALGAKNQLIKSIFFYHASSLIGRGILWGNLLGHGLCYIQYRFKIIHLDPRNYFMDVVPIAWSWVYSTLLSLIIFSVVVASLWIPVRFITTISPLKAIHFD